MTLLSTTISERLVSSLTKQLDDQNTLPLDSFIHWALYDPENGYYKQQRKRVGKSEESDFYTSSSFHKLWAKLILASSIKLLGKEKSNEYVFVEIAAEPESCLFSDTEHPFSSYKVIRLGDDYEIPPLAVVYSNEWLDAQPFKRFSYSKQMGGWCEHKVKLEKSTIREFITNTPISLKEVMPAGREEQPEDGYTIDWPTGAHQALLKLIQSSDWKGIFITFDYGFGTKREILENKPMGSGRAYKNHVQYNNILKWPGEQDITCHLCWEHIMELLGQNGFQNISNHSQESFLMKHAPGQLEKIISQGTQAEINKVKELIHPHYLGQKFQVITGRR
ncbi:MAG: SAM-dependent methyltransferase [Opitutales bacterium]|nr:SAM-dependent methyltransferase [Opitutales bacterium]